MRRTEPIQTNLENCNIAKKHSWLCRIFQEDQISAQEKVEVLRAVTNQHKKRRLQQLKTS